MKPSSFIVVKQPEIKHVFNFLDFVRQQRKAELFWPNT